MAKIALLIGVSNYQPGFNSLPGTQTDIREMQRVLQNPQMGGFDEVTLLPNPNKSEMELAIEKLLADRQRDDLVLLYFSGHGFKDDDGSLYFVTRTTEQRSSHQIYQSTAVPASVLQGWMSRSRCKRQVLVLDCCFSGAFAEGMKAKAVNAPVEIAAQFGGEGRAVLTSSTATQVSFEQQEAAVYTRYLVEGIETGAADTDNNGAITVDELHDYAKRKVQEAAPAMKPEIFAVKEGYKIVLAQAPVGNPKLEYRREVEQLAQRRSGKLSNLVLLALEEKRRTLKLAPDEAETIQLEVLRPYQEFEEKLRRYELVLAEEMREGFPLSESIRADLQYFQQVLGLRDEDIAAVELSVSAEQVKRQITALDTTTVDKVEVSEEEFNQILTEVIQQEPILLEETSEDSSLPQDASKDKGIDIALGEEELYEPFDQELILEADSSVEPGKNFPVLAGCFIACIMAGLILLMNLPPVHRSIGTSVTALSQPTPSPSVALASQMTAEEFFKRASDKYSKGDKAGAIQDYDQAIKIKPNNAFTQYIRGLVRYELGNKQTAIQDYDQAIKIKPDYADAYFGRGVARSDLGDKQGAIQDYDQAIKLKPDYANAYYNRGLERKALGDQQKAIEDYNQAIKLKPDFADAYSSRGNARYNLGDYQAAIQDYDQAIKLKPDFADAYYNRGTARYNLGDYQAAIQDYDQAIKLKPDFADAYYNRGTARYNLGDYQAAIQDYDQAIKLKPDFANAYSSRGNARYNLGDYQAAIQDYDQAIKLKPDYANAYYNRGLERKALGDQQAAIQDYQQAAKLYQQQGNTEWYQKALDRIKELQK